MLSSNRDNGLLLLGQKANGEHAPLEFLNWVQVMHHYIEEIRKLALEMVINKASFLMMVFYLRELKPVLEDLVKVPELLKTHSIWPTLHKLAETLKELYNFTHCCSSRSRIFLLYNSNGIVDEINRYFNALSLCLGAILAGCDVSLDLKSSMQAMQVKFRSSSIFQEPGYNALATEISTCMGDTTCDEAHATTLLRRIAEFLQVPDFEAAELKQELQDDFVKADSDGLPIAETLQALSDLFSSAQVLNERRRLASLDSPLLPTGISSIPSSFFCPITKCIMREPVMIAEEGFSYEKSAILEWFSRGHKTCPDTGKILESLELVPNLKLQQAMDEFFDHMHQAEMVYALQALRSQSVGMAVEQAVLSVKKLTDLGSKYRQLVVSLDGVEVFVGLLKPSPPHIRETIFKILIDICTAGDAQKEAIVECGTVRLLLGFLQKNPAEKSSSLQLLCELSKVVAGKVAIAAEKGSMLVVATVLNSSPENRKPQIRFLLDNLCKDDTEMTIEAAKSTLLEPLIVGLTLGNENTKLDLVSAVLDSFDLNEFNSAALVKAGIVPPLLSLAQNGSPESMHVALKLLSRLSCVEQNKMPLAQAGAIRVLVKFLAEPADEVKLHVTSILSNLATDRKNAQEMDLEGAVARLFNMMKSKDALLQEYSVKTLGSMTKDSGTVCNQVIELGMMPTFWTFLERGTLSVASQRNILTILHHVLKNSDNVRAVAPSSHGVMYLIGQLECDNMEERESLIAILEALSQAEALADIMLADEKLLMICAHNLGNSKMQESAAGLLAKFASYGITKAEVKAAFSKYEVFSALLALISNEGSTKMAKHHAAEAICHLSSGTPNLTAPASATSGCLASMGIKKFQACRVHGGKCSIRETFCLVEAGAIPSLVNLIKGDEVKTAGWAVKALYTLVDGTQYNRKGMDLLMKSGVLVPLVKLLGREQSSTEVSVQLLEKIFRVRKYRDSRNCNTAKTVLMQTMAVGNAEVRKLAATALMHLGMIPTDTSYMTATTT